MDTSTLAQFIGPIMGVIGLGFLLNPKFYMKIEEGFEKRNEIVILAGIINLIVGLLIVLNHNIWEITAAGLVTLVGWVALAKGVSIMLAPKLLLKTVRPMIRNKALFPIASVATLTIGGYLAWFGFFA